MSSLPPPPPPPAPGYAPPPPPPGGFSALPPIPWEARPQGNFVTALVETVKLFVSAPREAFTRMREKGDFGAPLLYAVILSWIGAIFNGVYGLVLPSPFTSFVRYFPPEMREAFAQQQAAGGGLRVVGSMLIAPIFVVIALFIGAGINHVCLMIVGGLSNSTAGYEGTFRVSSYSSVASLLYVVPIVGGLGAIVGHLILAVIGLSTVHRTTTGKAVAAILIPLALCCICCVLCVVLFAGAIGSALHR